MEPNKDREGVEDGIEKIRYALSPDVDADWWVAHLKGIVQSHEEKVRAQIREEIKAKRDRREYESSEEESFKVIWNGAIEDAANIASNKTV